MLYFTLCLGHWHHTGPSVRFKIIFSFCLFIQEKSTKVEFLLLYKIPVSTYQIHSTFDLLKSVPQNHSAGYCIFYIILRTMHFWYCVLTLYGIVLNKRPLHIEKHPGETREPRWTGMFFNHIKPIFTCFRVHRILLNKHACLSKRTPDFWLHLTISLKPLNRSESNFQHLVLRYSWVHTAKFR